MSKPKTAQQLAVDNLIVKHLAGSHSYGTAIASSDVDYRGVFVGDPINVRTPFFRVDEVNVTTEEDTKLYELSNFMKLAVDCNPNIIETLWVDDSSIVKEHPAFSLLRQAAPQLLSRRIAFTTVGYALSQLKRIKGHNKWINSPQPEQKPQAVDFVSMVQHFTQPNERATMPRDFDLRKFMDGWRLIPFGKDTFGLYRYEGRTPFNESTGSLNDDFEDESRVGLGAPTYVVKFNRQEFEDAKLRWEQYWEWKRNRNETRSALEEQHGFDTKHAMHLVRLLRMGYEAVTEGVIRVKRPDAEELLSIRNGAWTYDQIVEYAEDMNSLVETAVDRSDLPKQGNLLLAAKVVLQVQDAVWDIGSSGHGDV